MFARTYYPKASCICSYFGHYGSVQWSLAWSPRALCYHTPQGLWSFLPSDSACWTGTCVSAGCFRVGRCWEACVPWRSPWGPSKEKWNQKSTWRRKRGQKEDQPLLSRVLGSRQQGWAAPSSRGLCPVYTLLPPPLGQMFPTMALCWLPCLTFSCAPGSSQETPSSSLQPSNLPAREPLHKNVCETAEPQASWGGDYLYTEICESLCQAVLQKHVYFKKGAVLFTHSSGERL